MWEQRKLTYKGTPGNSALQKMKGIALLFMIIQHLPEKKKKKSFGLLYSKEHKRCGWPYE